MRSIFNQEEINAGLEKAIDSLEYEYQKEDIKKYIQTKEPIKILLLDQTNSGVTQLLEYMGEEETEMYVRSAGLHPSGKIEKWVLDILLKEDDITRYQCSSPIEELCKYDYLVPVGIHLDEKAYPFQRIYTGYQDFDKKQISREEAKEMMQDSEMKQLAEAEYYESKDMLPKIEEELKILLIPKDPDDDKNIICEIRAGAGGEEAALFAGTLFRMYTMYAERKHWKMEVLNENETGLGGYKEITFMVTGKGVYSRLKFESGVHRVQRVPDTESSGRIHTSTATVAVLPVVEDVEIEINPADIKMEVFRSSGAGGQHINKTDSAVRITHIPTGTVVTCQSQRSQIQNREQAMMMLKSKLFALMEEKQAKELKEIQGEQKEIAWGSQIRSYVLHPYSLVKDNRSLYESNNPKDVLDGNLDDFIYAYLKSRIQEGGHEE